MYNTLVMAIDYQQVIHESREELRESVAKRETLDRRITELRTALRALAKFIPESERDEVMQEVKSAKRKGVSLTESILELLGQPENKPGLTGNQIRERLEESGFDLGDYSQPLATVQTTLQRMADQKRVNRGFTKGGVLYKLSAGELLKKMDSGD